MCEDYVSARKGLFPEHLWPHQGQDWASYPTAEKRPSHFPLHVVAEDGSSQTLQLPTAYHPGPVLLVKWGPPRLLSRTAPDEQVPHELWMHFPEVKSLRSVFDKLRAKRIKSGEFDQRAFARLLAKIAYGFAIVKGMP